MGNSGQPGAPDAQPADIVPGGEHIADGGVIVVNGSPSGALTFVGSAGQ
jgi:hypothetical protein